MLKTKPLSGAVSATTNSSAVLVKYADHLTVQIIPAGASSANYAAKLQSSNDGTNWDDIASATTTLTDDTTKSISVSNTGFKWLRAVFTRTGGSFTDLTVLVTGKERRV